MKRFERVVIAGGGIAGLLAAAALAPHAGQVTLFERDPIGPDAGHRRGVPQGWHAHALLSRGLGALETLIPGLSAQLVADGGLLANAATDVSWGLAGGVLAAAPDRLPVVVASRPLLEAVIRRAVLAIANVEMRSGARVRDFAFAAGRVTGVELDGAGLVAADLTVDATGRGSRLPGWLTAHGYAAPNEEGLPVDVGYATARFAADLARLDGRRAILVGATPDHPRGGVLHAIEHGQIEVSLTGYAGQHPPADPAGFVAFAAALARPDIHQLIHDASPHGPIAQFRVARTQRRQYHKLRRWPGGLIAVGDAVCAFNPVFAQGMTVAALQAVRLRQIYGAANADPAAPRHAMRAFAAFARDLAPAWQMARGNDLVMPHLAAFASPPERLVSAWIRRLLAAGAGDPLVARRFIRVASLVDPPQTLFAPATVFRVLRARPALGAAAIRPDAATPARAGAASAQQARAVGPSQT